MDRASILGIVSGFGLLIWAIFMGGSVQMFWNLPALMITLGGTVTATLISYPMSTFVDVLKIAKNAFLTKEEEVAETVNILVEFADKAKRKGLLALDEDTDALDDLFLQKGIRLVIDGTPPELVRNILETELTFIAERHKVGQRLFETMGSFAPAFGMLGTLIGLIQMLVSLDDPEKIGPGMAVALVTTFYGSLLANLFFLPIANKLKSRSAREIFIKQTIIEGVLSIQAGDNPRVIQEKLKSFLAPKEREKVTMPFRSKEVTENEPPFVAR